MTRLGYEVPNYTYPDDHPGDAVRRGRGAGRGGGAAELGETASKVVFG